MVSGVCAALAAGYLTVAERSDSSLEPIRGSATDFRADHTLRPRANSGLISTEAAELPAADRQQDKVVPGHQPEWSPRDEARREVSTRTVTVDGTGENIAIAYSSDPYGILPKWLTENVVEVPRKPFGVPLEEGERVKQTLENAVVDPLPSSLDGSAVASSERKVDTPEGAIVQARPQNDVPTLADTSTLVGKSRTAEPAPVGSPEPAEALPPRPKTTSPVLQSAPKPALSSESQPVARLGGTSEKGMSSNMQVL